MKSIKQMMQGAVKVLPVTLLAGFLVTGCSYSGAEAQLGIGIEANSGTSEFSALAGYGEWANITPYGRVWRPYVIDGWRPFTDGHWAWTSVGWTWVSYEPYGWLVYHYGDWDYDPDFGWFWIPGTVWSPARVRWMTYGGYVGWAPIGPRGVMWGAPWERSRFDVWTMVPFRDFDRDDVGRYRMAEPPLRRERFDHRSDFHPPRFNSIQRASNGPVPQFNLQRERVRMGDHDYSRVVLPPGERQRVEEHRPEFRRHETRPGHLRPAPESRRPEKRPPPNMNNRGGHETHGRNDHAGREPRSERSNRGGEPPQQRYGEHSRRIPQYHAYGHKEQRDNERGQEKQRYSGRDREQQHSQSRSRSTERSRDRGRDREIQQHHERSRHFDPHREQPHHSKTSREHKERNKLL